MGLIIVYGGQYGSEGKGKIASYLAEKLDSVATVKVGGTNSGHSVVVDGEVRKLRMLPTAALTTNCDVIFPAGSYIDVGLLLAEIEVFKVEPGRIFIDPNAIVIQHEDVLQEKDDKLREKISSTESGTGAAVIRRARRLSEMGTALTCTMLEEFICPTKTRMRDFLRKDRSIIVEGTQGYLLSCLHTPFYPYCTARDTSAAGILSEVGMSIRDVDKTCMVFRAFPIRVKGNSGPLPLEVSWDYITNLCGANKPIVERTTVTNRIRRVAEFDFGLTEKVLEAENPDWIAMNHLDYFGYDTHDKEELSNTAQTFVKTFEEKLNRNIDFYGTGAGTTFEIK